MVKCVLQGICVSQKKPTEAVGGKDQHIVADFFGFDGGGNLFYAERFRNIRTGSNFIPFTLGQAYIVILAVIIGVLSNFIYAQQFVVIFPIINLIHVVGKTGIPEAAYHHRKSEYHRHGNPAALVKSRIAAGEMPRGVELSARTDALVLNLAVVFDIPDSLYRRNA